MSDEIEVPPSQEIELRQELLPSEGSVGYLWSGMAHLAFPHRDPLKGKPSKLVNDLGELVRQVGQAQLVMERVIARDPNTGQRTVLPFPSGNIPRLLFLYVVTEAVKTQSPVVDLGNSMREFMQRIGLKPDRGGRGTDRARLGVQLPRFLNVRFVYNRLTPTDEWVFTDEGELRHPTHERSMKFDPVQEFQLWHNVKADLDQRSLFESWMRLSPDFYRQLVEQSHAYPIQLDTLAQIRNSSLAIDLYSWLTFKSHHQAGKPYSLSIKLDELMTTFGPEYQRTSKGRVNFKNQFVAALKAVDAAYEGLRVEWDHRPGTLKLLGTTRTDTARKTAINRSAKAQRLTKRQQAEENKLVIESQEKTGQAQQALMAANDRKAAEDAQERAARESSMTPEQKAAEVAAVKATIAETKRKLRGG